MRRSRTSTNGLVERVTMPRLAAVVGPAAGVWPSVGVTTETQCSRHSWNRSPVRALVNEAAAGAVGGDDDGAGVGHGVILPPMLPQPTVTVVTTVTVGWWSSQVQVPSRPIAAVEDGLEGDVVEQVAADVLRRLPPSLGLVEVAGGDLHEGVDGPAGPRAVA